MKYTLPRPILSEKQLKILKREMQKQKINLELATSKSIKELSIIIKAIEKEGIPSHLVCKRLPHELGRGIFLHPKADPIEKGAVVGLYSGEILILPENEFENGSYAFTPVTDMFLNKKEQKMLDPDSSFKPNRKYLLKIDALKSGNFTRFINHSAKPNVQARQLAIPSNKSGVKASPLEIFYFAKKKILPGEQLLVCYEDGEKSYWGSVKPFVMVPHTFRLDASLRLISA